MSLFIRLLLLFITFFPSIGSASVLEPHKENCKIMGFEENTEPFANCVMKLFNSSKSNSSDANTTKTGPTLSLDQTNQLLLQQQIQQQNNLNSEIKRLRRQQGLSNALKGLDILKQAPPSVPALTIPKKTYCNDFGTQINCSTY